MIISSNLILNIKNAIIIIFNFFNILMNTLIDKLMEQDSKDSTDKRETKVDPEPFHQLSLAKEE